jgi:holliday junction DNA helicase RuvA
VGRKVRLYIHDVYREDDQALYGFSTREERDFFRLLVEKVSGIGPRTALALLSKLSVASIASAVAAGDVALLSKTPGIGKKTAERIVIELRDKFAPGGAQAPGASGSSPALPANPVTDAISALMALGYNLDTADKAVRKAVGKLGSEAPTEALLKSALSAG